MAPKAASDTANISSDEMFGLVFRLSPLDKLGWPSRKIANLAADFLSGGIQQYVGGEPLDLKFLGEFGILSFFGCGLFLTLGEVELNQNELVRREIGKRFLVKHLFVHLDAPRAPVGSGEIQQHQLFFARSLALGLAENCGPTYVSGESASPRKYEDRRQREEKGTA